MKRRVFILGVMVLTLGLLSGCGKKSDSGITSSSEKKPSKGTMEDPYTINDTITLTSYIWEGNRFANMAANGQGVPSGSNTWEFSNFRIENYKGLDVLVYDKKCIETSEPNGADDSIFVSEGFNSNMQTQPVYDVSDDYINSGNIIFPVYFTGTKYTKAIAMCSQDTNYNLVPSEEKYSMVRIIYYDENLEDAYVYIKLN